MKKQVIAFGLVASLLISLIACSPNQSRVQALEVKPFSDVKSNFWAYKEIEDLRNKGIAEPLSGDKFAPNTEITRSKAARMMVKALGAENESFKDISFADATKQHPDYKFIAIAVNKGIFSGKPDGTFDPNGNLTRAQMAKILAIAFEIKVKGQHNLKDVSNNHWADQYVDALYSNNITTGTNGMYLPNASVTRVHQAVFLYRSMQLPKEVVTNPEQDLMPDFMKDTTVFSPDIKFNPFVLKNPLLVKILEEGQAVVRKNNMLIIEANNGVEAKSEGYKNPKDDNFRQVRLEQHGNDTRTFTLRFDFRDERAIDVATNWLNILLPEANLAESINAKALEADGYEKRGEYFMGNNQRIKVGDYEIKYGCNTFLEFFNLEATYVGK
jgi:hypothetical protein